MDDTPNVLCIGGHDPTGGAGIQADIETIAALGGRALTLISALTAQDTGDVRSILPMDAAYFAEQAATLVDDIQPAAVKIGLLGSLPLVEAAAALLERLTCPVVLDPVLAAGGGFELSPDGLAERIHTRLVARATLVTPNRAEARRLTGLADAQDAADLLLHSGAQAVLLTGADEAADGQVVNQLYRQGHPVHPFSWPLLPDRYHGSGCTLASACAARLALGDPMPVAVEAAQRFTWRALEQATRPGRGQALPRRCR